MSRVRNWAARGLTFGKASPAQIIAAGGGLKPEEIRAWDATVTRCQEGVPVFRSSELEDWRRQIHKRYP